MPNDEQVIYRSSIRLKNGRRIFAKHYGKEAFRIVIKPKKKQPRLPGL